MVAFDRDVMGSLALVDFFARPLLFARATGPADDFEGLLAGFFDLRFAGFAGGTIASHTLVIAETVARRIFFAALARVRL